MPPGTAAVLFDLDGTLFDTQAANTNAYQQAFKELGLYFDRTGYLSNFGLRYDAMVRAISPGITPEQAAIIKRLKSQFYQDSRQLMVPNLPLISFLKHCHNVLRLKTGLCTTASKNNVLPLIAHFQLENDFDLVITGEEVINGKPHPDCYQLATTKLSVSPQQTVVFEDSDIGIQAAISAKTTPIRVVTFKA